MKLKYYLRGCGIGILLASIVMIVSLQSHGGVMTDAKAMKRAAELGMVMSEDTEDNGMKETMSTQSTQIKETEGTLSTEKKVQTNAERKEKNNFNKYSQKTSENSSGTSSEKTKEKSSEASSEKTQKENAKESSKKEQGKDIVSITVRQGEVCRGIAEDLYKKGLVRDSEEFRKYMQDHNYDNMICAGTFQLKKGMSYEEIAKILTTKPES